MVEVWLAKRAAERCLWNCSHQREIEMLREGERNTHETRLRSLWGVFRSHTLSHSWWRGVFCCDTVYMYNRTTQRFHCTNSSIDLLWPDENLSFSSTFKTLLDRPFFQNNGRLLDDDRLTSKERNTSQVSCSKMRLYTKLFDLKCKRVLQFHPYLAVIFSFPVAIQDC